MASYESKNIIIIGKERIEEGTTVSFSLKSGAVIKGEVKVSGKDIVVDIPELDFQIVVDDRFEKGILSITKNKGKIKRDLPIATKIPSGPYHCA